MATVSDWVLMPSQDARLYEMERRLERIEGYLAEMREWQRVHENNYERYQSQNGDSHPPEGLRQSHQLDQPDTNTDD